MTEFVLAWVWRSVLGWDWTLQWEKSMVSLQSNEGNRCMRSDRTILHAEARGDTHCKQSKSNEGLRGGGVDAIFLANKAS